MKVLCVDIKKRLALPDPLVPGLILGTDPNSTKDALLVPRPDTYCKTETRPFECPQDSRKLLANELIRFESVQNLVW